MLLARYRYPHGRLGSEIAYSIARNHMGIEDLTLNDPSEGGADMMSRDGRIIFENRLLTITGSMPAKLLERQVEFQLGRLRARLKSDLSYYNAARLGYVSLSYIESGELRTDVFEMKKR